MKNKLGIGQEDRYDYGHSGGPRGVIAVEVPNYQRHRQRQMPAHITGLVGQPLPKLPTPFAAAQVPLPDDNDDPGGHMPLSRAGSIPLADARALAHLGDKVKDTSGKRGCSWWNEHQTGQRPSRHQAPPFLCTSAWCSCSRPAWCWHCAPSPICTSSRSDFCLVSDAPAFVSCQLCHFGQSSMQGLQLSLYSCCTDT